MKNIFKLALILIIFLFAVFYTKSGVSACTSRDQCNPGQVCDRPCEERDPETNECLRYGEGNCSGSSNPGSDETCWGCFGAGGGCSGTRGGTTNCNGCGGCPSGSTPASPICTANELNTTLCKSCNSTGTGYNGADGSDFGTYGGIGSAWCTCEATYGTVSLACSTNGACNTTCSTGGNCASGVCTATVFGNLCDCSAGTTASPSPSPSGGGGGNPPAPVCTTYPVLTCCTTGNCSTWNTFYDTQCCDGQTATCNSNNTGIICVGGNPPGGGNEDPPPPVCSGVCSASPVCETTTYGSDTGCGSSCSVTGGACAAWWQAKDADIATAGDIRSTIPTAVSLILPGTGGSAGIPVYSGNTYLGSGNISSSSWNSKTSYTGRRYDYDWFKSLVPGDTETVDCSGGCNLSGGDLVSKAKTDKVALVIYNGDVTVSSQASLNNKRVGIFVNGNLNINARIKLDQGKGFFMAIVKKDILVDPSITHASEPAIEGLYLADGLFKTGTGSSRFYLRGSIAAWGGITLQRNLGANRNQPAEFFEYAPDLILLFPPQLFRDGVVWREVAP